MRNNNSEEILTRPAYDANICPKYIFANGIHIYEFAMSILL